MRGPCLRAGTVLLALAAFGISFASMAIMSQGVDLATRTSRHLLAGALANGFLSVLLVVLALVPLRRGQRWAFWAYLIPVVGYGVPMFVVDATHVARENLLMTLLPQGLGLGVAAVGLALVAYALFATGGR